MITDNETNKVYFSELLKTNSDYEEAYNGIIRILKKHKVDYDFLKGTKDIWTRDYMPVQKNVESFVQFRYEPSYLQNDIDLEYKSDPNIVCDANKLNPKFSNINLDGGNVIKWHDKVIISTRVFRENLGYGDSKLISDIQDLLEVQVILFPEINPGNDLTGHADGYVRFIDANTILVNEIKKNEFKYWLDGFQKMVKQHQLNCIEVPWFEFKVKNFPDSAIGLYLNYLEIGNLIILPIFDVIGNMDQKVIDLFNSLFPYKQIEPVNINQVAHEGGLMNCISWNIKI
jgi:agmatine deiminase